MLAALNTLGSARSQRATLGEAFLQPGPVNGAGLLKMAVPDPQKRSKILAVLCRLAQAFPHLPDQDREVVLAYWRAALREAVASTKAQVAEVGFGGDKTRLLDLAAIDRAITALPPGNRNRLAMMFYRYLPCQGDAEDHVRTFWNMGAVRVVFPGSQEPTQAEKQAAVLAYADGPRAGADTTTTTACAGWLVLNGKEASQDNLQLFEGIEADTQMPVIVKHVLPRVLSDELRCHYLAQRPGQAWLFVDLAHKDCSKGQPYLFAKGRDSFLKSINDRFLRPQLQTTLGAIKTAALADRLQKERNTTATDHAA